MTDVVVSAVEAYLKYSLEIEKITIISGRVENLDKIRDRICLTLTPAEQMRLNTVVMEEIDYQERLQPPPSIKALKKKLIGEYCGDGNIWWIHNFHLGKNPYFTGALLDIAEETSQRMIFHIHDFPECSRYELLNNLLSTVKRDIYSLVGNIRYAVLNSRDYRFLIESGIPEKMLFLLENPLAVNKLMTGDIPDVSKILTKAFSKDFPGWKSDQPYMLYPVRSIRRKNVAEAAFISSLSDANVIVTLPGVSDRERNYSHRSGEIFGTGLAPGLFGIGADLPKAGISFSDLIAGASLILSTSIQEGFGYLFLNSLNWGKPLIARDLDVLENFKPAFVDFDALFYDGVSVPASCLDIPELIGLYRKKVHRLSALIPEDMVKDINGEIDSLFSRENIDFSYLSLEMQIDFLKQIKNDSELFNQCRKVNESIINHIKNFFITDCSHRKDIIEQNWSLPAYSKRTDAILHSFFTQTPLPEHDRSPNLIYESILKQFLSLPYLRLLYDE